jgi:acetyl esterase
LIPDARQVEPDLETAALLDRIVLDFAGDPVDPTLGERRAALDRMAQLYGPPVDPAAAVEDRVIASPGGPIRVRIHGAGGPSGRPVLVNLHGGGWVLGGPDTYAGVMQAYQAAGDCVVVDVDYRRAPETRYPGALEDSLAALAWTHAHAAALGGDPARVVLTGDSAGGYLAARAALTTTVPLAGLVLVYPVLAVGAGHDLPSRERLGDGRFFLGLEAILRAETEFFDAGQRLDDPEFSPLAAPPGALSALPRMMVVAASLDPLLDEARLFAERVRDVSGDVRWRLAEGTIHAFVLFAHAIGCGRDVIGEIGAFVREAGSM